MTKCGLRSSLPRAGAPFDLVISASTRRSASVICRRRPVARFTSVRHGTSGENHGSLERAGRKIRSEGKKGKQRENSISGRVAGSRRQARSVNRRFGAAREVRRSTRVYTCKNRPCHSKRGVAREPLAFLERANFDEVIIGAGARSPSLRMRGRSFDPRGTPCSGCPIAPTFGPTQSRRSGVPA